LNIWLRHQIDLPEIIVRETAINLYYSGMHPGIQLLPDIPYISSSPEELTHQEQ